MLLNTRVVFYPNSLDLSHNSKIREHRRTLSWKTEFDRSIPVMEDWIFRLLHHYHKDMLQEG